MTKTEALELLNCGVTELANMLGITSQAVTQWPEAKIPLAREYQVMDLVEGKEPIKHPRLVA